MPLFTVVDLCGNFPHLSSEDIDIHGQKHRKICLYERELIVKSLFSAVEKIDFIVSSLLSLLNLSPIEMEEEYRKEFLLYWNQSSVGETEIFIETSLQPNWLNVYDDSNKKRIVHPSIQLSDLKKDCLNTKIQALYIPIIDTRGVIPPHKYHSWTLVDILNILDNKQFSKITFETYNELCNYSYSKKTIILVFEMSINQSTVSFCCEIKFANSGTMKLLSKIKQNTESVNTLFTRRCDFKFLNKQIGNDTNLLNKKVAIIGTGSLGSYIASEIVKIGIKDLVIIDYDTLHPENLMRYRGIFLGSNHLKVRNLQFELEMLHPEVKVKAINQKIDKDNIFDLVSEDIDLIIFSVGSSDVQLACNWRFKKSHYTKPVLFCWLEGNGKAGHVLAVDYSKRGCYQCLYTDMMGVPVNNKINSTTDSEMQNYIIRNGCGGTRVAYGNSILLQTCVLTLSAIRKIFSDEFICNFIMSFKDNYICETTDFHERSCVCCNEN